MVERIGSHKKLRGFSALATSALFVASCATGTEVSQTSSFAPENSPTQTQTNTKTPDVVAPSFEVEKTPLEESKRVALDLWLSAFNYSGTNDKKEQYSFTASIKTSTDNFERWKETQVNNILNGQDSNEVLQIRWEDLLVSYNPDNQKQGAANKYVGDLEINNTSVYAQESPFPLTAADKSNGIRWKGIVGISYAERYRALYYKGILFGQPWKDLSTQTWINKDPADPMPEFSPWYDAKSGIELLLMSNGQWKMVEKDQRSANDFNFEGLLTPSYYANPDNTMGTQTTVPCTKSGYPCELIKVTF